ncbi:MAG: proton-conducting transporter membrane subunit [Sulfolobales archaeon]
MPLLPVDQLFLLFPILAGFSLSMPLAELLGIGGRGSKYMAISAILISLAILLISPPQPSISPGSISGFIVNMDSIAYPIAIAILIGALIGVITIPLDATDSIHIYLAMILMGVLASIMLAMARDPVAAIASWTLLSITTFATIALARDRESLEASVRYAIVGGLASQLLILGIAFSSPYMVLGSAFGDMIPGVSIAIGFIAIAFISIAIGFKLGAVPSHSWVPDVYGVASPYVVAVISGSLKLGALALAIWVLKLLGPIASNAFPVLAFMSFASMVIGSITPLTQTNAQRILAYSSIAHMGFLFIGLAVISLSQNSQEVFRLAMLGVAFHTIAYSLGKSGVFAALNYIKRIRGTLDLSGIRGVARADPKLSFSLTLHILNLIGVPPLPGFWGKLFLFLAAAQNIGGLYIGSIPWLAVVGIAASVISVYYYLNILRPSIMLLDSGSEVSGGGLEGKGDPDLWASYVAAILTIILGIFIYIFSQFIY